MDTYLVTWQVNVDSDSDDPLDVAADALGIQRAPGSTATMFTVINERTGQRWQVDLDEETVDELPAVTVREIPTMIPETGSMLRHATTIDTAIMLTEPRD